MVEKTEHPAITVPLKYGQRGVVLSQHENALEGEAEGSAEDDAVGTAVRDHQHAFPGMPRGDGLEGGPRSGLHLGQALALWKLKAPDIGHPCLEGRRLAPPDLLGREAFPASHR